MILYLYIFFVSSLTGTYSICPTGKFRCETRFGIRCLSNSWKCDGKNDCQDSVDEKNCTVCNPALWACNSSRPTALECLPRRWRCDGKTECKDGSDEVDCDKTTKPTTTTTTTAKIETQRKNELSKCTNCMDPIASVNVTVTKVKPSGDAESHVLFLILLINGFVFVLMTVSGIFLWRFRRKLCEKISSRWSRSGVRARPSMMVDVHGGTVNESQPEENVPLQSVSADSATENDKMVTRDRLQPQRSSIKQTGKRLSEYRESDMSKAKVATDNDCALFGYISDCRADMDNFKILEQHLKVTIPNTQSWDNHEDTEVKSDLPKFYSDNDNPVSVVSREDNNSRDTQDVFVHIEQLPTIPSFYNSTEKIPHTGNGCVSC